MTAITNTPGHSAIENTLTPAQRAGRAKVGAALQMLKKQGDFVQSQLTMSGMQLSSIGQLKSSVSNAQLSAKALGGLTAASSAEDVTSAASRFVEAFNLAIKAAKSTATAPGTSLADTNGVGRITADLKRAVEAGGGGANTLKKMGIDVLADGTMTLNSTKFDAALKAGPSAMRSALSRLGNTVEKTAGAELGERGAVSSVLSSFNNRSNGLKAQQTAIQSTEKKLAAYTRLS